MGVHVRHKDTQGREKARGGVRAAREEAGEVSLRALEALDEGDLTSRQVPDGGGEGSVLDTEVGHGGQEGSLCAGGGRHPRVDW